MSPPASPDPRPIENGPPGHSLFAALEAAFQPLSDLHSTGESDLFSPPTIAPDTSPVPSDRYRFDGEIARGGIGAILRGHDPGLKRDIAIKVLLQAHQDHPELLQRFIEEAQIGGQLQHPGMVPVYELGRFADQRPYFTMKLVKGRTLAALLAERQEPRQDRPRFLKIFESVCQTVAYAHSKGVIHRDLKPNNIMVGAFGEVQVMDWGLAKVLPSGGEESPEPGDRLQPESVIRTVRHQDSDTDEVGSGTRTGTVLGTPAYMAPEQARGETLDASADVFGLGAILCEILTGKPPFLGVSAVALRKAQSADLGDALARLADCGADSELIALARRCLAEEARDRPADASVVADSVTAHRESVEARLRQSELAEAEARARAIEERKRRKLTLALAASVLVTVLVAGGGYAWVLQGQRSERIARQRQSIDEALDRAAVLRGQAVAAPVGDLSGWAEAQSETGRAKDLLAQGEPDPALQERVSSVQADLERGRAEAERRARDAEAERKLAIRLESIRSERGEHFDPKRADREYSAAFRAFGLDLDSLEPTEAGARLAGRPRIAEIAAALDEWCTIRRLGQAMDKAGRPWRRLAEVARAADPDPWRNRLRATFGAPLPKATAALKKQSEDTAALKRQPAASLVLLAFLLKEAGERDRSTEVLLFAWQRFPGDFWVNFDLGISSWSGTSNENPERAVRFLTAAVAARPSSPGALSNLGAVLFKQGKVDEAIAAYRRAIELDPGLAAPHTNLGIALGQQGKLAEAVAAHRKAIALDSKVALAHVGLGNALRKQSKLEEAIRCYREATRLDPRYVKAHNHLGIALASQGKLDEAIGCHQKALGINPRDADAHHGLGVALSLQDKLDEGIASFRKAIEIDPRFALAHCNLGKALARQGKPGEAIRCLRESIRIDPSDAYAHHELGIALSRQGKLDEAIRCFETAIEINSRDANSHNDLGLALAAKGKLPDAISEYRKAIEIGPTNTKAHSNLGLALTDQGRLDEAIGCFDKAIGSDPRNAKAHVGRGLVLAQRDKVDEAITCFLKAIDLDKKVPLAHVALGNALQKQGKLKEAIGCYLEAIRLDPRDAKAHNNLGIALSGQGKLNEAIKYHREAIKIAPRYALAYNELGGALSAQGKLDEAIGCFDKAIEINPGDAPTWYNLGLALFHKRKLADAVARWEKAIEIDPRYAQAHGTLGMGLIQQGQFARAEASTRRALQLLPSDDPRRAGALAQRQQCRYMLALEKALPDVLAGKTRPASAVEYSNYAQVCLLTRRSHAAARLSIDAFAARPGLAPKLLTSLRHSAARAAALAASGQGSDAGKLTDRERFRWRRQALTWLRAGLNEWARRLESGRPVERAEVAAAQGYWLEDSALAGVRDGEALAKLSREEREACRNLWSGVRRLLEKAKGK